MEDFKVHKAKRQNIIVLSIICLIIMFFSVGIGILKYNHTFTTEKWNSDKENRFKIVNSLIEKYHLVGMSESELIELLGEEDSDSSSFKISRKSFPPDTTLVYYLGVDYIDTEWLVISLNNGIVCDYCIDVS